MTIDHYHFAMYDQHLLHSLNQHYHMTGDTGASKTTLGMIPLGIPLIWIVPWVSLAYALLYFKLFGAEGATLAD